MNHEQPSPEFFHRQTAEELAAALGFVETPQLLNLRTAIVLEYSIDRKRAIQLKIAYEILAEEIIDDLETSPTERADAQIGLILMCASMKLYAGLMEDYDFELEQAGEYAYNKGDNTLIDQIESLIIQSRQEP